VGKSFIDVGEAWVTLRDAVEQASCIDDVPHTIIQIGCHVPLTKVVFLDALRHSEHRLEHFDRLGNLALIGKRTRRDDPAFGQRRRMRRCALQFLPEVPNLCPAVQGTIRIGKHRQYRGSRRIEHSRRLEFVDDGSPLFLTISRQSGQLVYEGHPWQLTTKGSKQPRCFGESFTFERVDRLLQTFRSRLRLASANSTFDVARNI